MYDPCFILFKTVCPYSFAIILMEKISSIVFLRPCNYLCYVFLPRGVVGWSVVCDCYFLIMLPSLAMVILEAKFTCTKD